jgi:serine/threonine-protein kinase
MIGTRLGPYELVEELGKGGMATVYRAYQPNTDRFVAVKVIHRAIASDSAGLERFQREARLVTRLEHPHLLPIYDYNGTHDPPYIVMRYLEGGTLKDILDQGPLPPDEIIYMMRQIAAALDYAHRKGVIHRDIKPSNVLIDPDGNAFLTDFGIARMTEVSSGLTRSGFTVGTPAYMSPEQATGSGQVDGRSDIYALGVMLFQMLTGQMPYTADTPMATLLKHLNDPIPAASSFNTRLDAGVDAVFFKTLAKKPDDRYATATGLVNALAEALNTSPIITPNNLRTAAQKTLETQAIARSPFQESIDKTMAQFEASRPGFMAAQTPPVSTRMMPDDAPTMKPPSVPDIKAPTSSLGNTQKMAANRQGWWLIGGIALLLALGAGVLVLTQPIPFTQATATALPTTAVSIVSTDTQVSEPTRSPATEVPPSATATQTTTPSLTATASRTPTSTPTDTPTWTATFTRTYTPTPTDTPTLTPTVTPATPVAQSIRELVALVGPDISYPVVATIPADERLDIIGVSTDGDWYQVLLPDGQTAWVRERFITAAGDILGVPVALAPTNTPTDTPTPTPTLTPTVTPSPTPTLTPTVTPSATLTATITPSPTLTSTATASPTGTPTPLPTVTPTRTPSAGDTPLPLVPPPLPTAIPAGRLPFVADFEAGAQALEDWDYDPAAWQVATEGGENVLLGIGTIRNPATVLGLEPAPEWTTDTGGDLVLNLSINLPGTASAGRVIFRCTGARCAGGYQVLEILSGFVALRRNAGSPDLLNREGERVLDTARAPIEVNRWHEITLWTQGNRLYVYVDRQFVMSQEDLSVPTLQGGAVILQTITTPAQPIRFDNLILQRPEAASEHFEGSARPSLWRTTSSTGTTIERESNGNRYLQLRGEAVLTPNIRPIRDINLACRVNVQEGDYRLYLRDSSSGSLELTFTAGNLIIRALNDVGEATYETRVGNFFNRLRWEDLNIRFIGNNLTLYRDGVPRFDEDVPGVNTAGGIRIENRARDILQLDDCLITETAQSSNAEAQFALDLQKQVLARTFADFRSDFVEFFDDPFRTDDWWVDGTEAAGAFINDPASASNQQFLRVTGSGRETFRLLRERLGSGMFASGVDNFTTDLYVTVDVRFPEGGATASLGIRTMPTLSGTSLEGYFLDLRRNADGGTDVIVRQAGLGGGTLYEGPLPGEASPEWINLTIISFEDRVAFFANGQFLYALRDGSFTTGSLALGVIGEGTADFDTLVMRDTTPLGG